MKSWSNYSHNCIWPILPNVKKLLFTTNQRNRGSFRLWGTSGNLWFNLQLTAGAALRSDQAAQVFIYSGIGNLQGQKLHNLLGQPMPLPDCVHGKTTLLTSAATLSSFHSCQLPLNVLPMWWAQFCPLCELFAGTAAAARYFQSYLCTKVSISSSPNFSPQHKCSNSHPSSGFCWTVSNSLMSSLYCGLTGGCIMQVCCSECWAEEIITSSVPAHAAQDATGCFCFWDTLLANAQFTAPKKPRAFFSDLLPKQLIPSLSLGGVHLLQIPNFAFVLVAFFNIPTHHSPSYSELLWMAALCLIKYRSCTHSPV